MLVYSEALNHVLPQGMYWYTLGQIQDPLGQDSGHFAESGIPELVFVAIS